MTVSTEFYTQSPGRDLNGTTWLFSEQHAAPRLVVEFKLPGNYLSEKLYAAGNGGPTDLLEQDFGAPTIDITPQNVPGASPLPPGEGQGEGGKRITRA